MNGKERFQKCHICGNEIIGGECHCYEVVESGKPAAKEKTGTLEDWW